MKIFNPKLALIAPVLAMLSMPVHSAGLSGVPSEITGISSSQGEAAEDVERGSNALSRYIVEQVKQAPVPRPNVGVRAATDNQELNSDVVRPVSAVESVNAAGVSVSQTNSNSVTSMAMPVSQVRSIQYKLPEGLREVRKNALGSAKIDGDKPGTYVVRVPPLFFSRLKLPFDNPRTEVPFPDKVEIRSEAGMLMVAPTTNIPVNLIVFHPQKPELSIALVLLPDGNEIPATIEVSFDESRLPQQVKEEAPQASGKVLGISSVLQEGDSRVAAKFERSADHISTLESIHTLISKGLVPDGFSLEVVTEGATGALCGDRRLVGQFAQRMTGDQFVVDVFQVTNAADDVLRFEEKNCYRQGVASIQFNPSRTIAPGQKAELIIVHAVQREEAPAQIRRPTLASGGAM